MIGNLLLKIPRNRVGVLIGPEGSVKAEIEKRLKVRLKINSETGDVTISPQPGNEYPVSLFQAKEYVQAIGRGFSPERASLLLEDNEDVTLTIIDLREIVGRSASDIKRVKGRVIGRAGKMRRIIEELTETRISVFGHTISIIGKIESVEIAKEAITMLIKGSQHSTVNRFLHRKRRELKRKMLELWEETPK